MRCQKAVTQPSESFQAVQPATNAGDGQNTTAARNPYRSAGLRAPPAEQLALNRRDGRS